jgi:hypothetical protein
VTLSTAIQPVTFSTAVQPVIFSTAIQPACNLLKVESPLQELGLGLIGQAEAAGMDVGLLKRAAAAESGRLAQPRASLPLSDNPNTNASNDSCNRMWLSPWARLEQRLQRGTSPARGRRSPAGTPPRSRSRPPLAGRGPH